MDVPEFLKMRRKIIGITQAELAYRLSDLWTETSPPSVGHWETGRNQPPMENLDFRIALATALEMDVNTMMSELGYIVKKDDLSEMALRIALLVEKLDKDKQDLVLRLAQQVARG